MDLGLVLSWVLEGYCRECANLIDVKCFDATVADGKNLVIYDSSCLDCDTALCAWKERRAVLSRWCVGALVDTRFADMQFVRCEQESFLLSQAGRRYGCKDRSWPKKIRGYSAGSLISHT